MKIARSFVAVLAVTLFASHSAPAIPILCHYLDITCKVHPDGPSSVPEIDPAMGMGALALLGGAILVIRGRKKA